MTNAERPVDMEDIGSRTGLVRGIIVVLGAVAVGLLILGLGMDRSDEGVGSETVAAGSVTESAGEESSPADGSDQDAAADDSAASGPEVDADRDTAGIGQPGDGGDTASADGMAESDGTAAGDTGQADGTGPAADTEETAATTSSTEAAASTVTQPSARPAAEIVVQVLNAGGPRGIAGRASTSLSNAGFDVLAAQNAVSEFQAAGVTRLLVAPGNEGEAALVANHFGLPEMTVETLDPANPPMEKFDPATVVVLLIGPDDMIDV